MKKTVVIGGGAAGLIAAGEAARNGNRVVLVERNNILGKKLLITGKGRCNLTNSADIEDMLLSYPVNGKFLYSALYSFTNQDIVDLVESYGAKTKVERGGRVFPVSDKSKDIVDALSKFALGKDVKLVHARVKKLIIEDNKIKGVKTTKGDILCDSVIVATGGKSYTATGSTGDGYDFAREAGHTITELKPSLVPVETEENYGLMGLSLRNVRITAYNSKNKEVFSDFGEMLFTHYGISGPIVLSMSSHLRNMKKEKYRIEIDLKPALSDKQLDDRILRDFTKYLKKHLINSLDELLPKAMIPVIIKLAEIDEHKKISEITKQERLRLVDLLKHMPLTVKKFRPLEEAIITSGGVSVKEINPSTMESKLVSGLFFAGEVIDIDGYTGGYNLQAAFSTGYLAGINV